MSEYLESHPNLLRQSTVGDVIYVHLERQRRNSPPPAPLIEPEPEPEAVSLLSVEPVTEPEASFEEVAESWEELPAEVAELSLEEAVAEEAEAAASAAEEAEAVASAAEEAEAVASAAEEAEEVAAEPAPAPVEERGWPYRIAPQGYAVEFGTGRLVPIVYAGGRH